MPYVTSQALWLIAPGGGGSMFPNVVAWREHEPDFRGGRQRAFDGTLLSSEYAPKFSASATVEFWSAADLLSFEAFISSGQDVYTGRTTGSRRLYLAAASSVLTVTAGGGGIYVYVHMGTRTPFEYVSPNPSQPNFPLLTLGWTVELLIEEA